MNLAFPLFPPPLPPYANLQEKLDCITLSDELTTGVLVMDTTHNMEEPAMATGTEVDSASICTSVFISSWNFICEFGTHRQRVGKT